MAQNNWKTINVKKALVKEAERLLQTETAKEAGISNMAQFLDMALREKLERLERKRFDHINMHDDHVKILDNNLEKCGRIVSVYFQGIRAWCDYCEEHMCVHIEYAWDIPSVRKILDERRVVPPPSRFD